MIIVEESLNSRKRSDPVSFCFCFVGILKNLIKFDAIRKKLMCMVKFQYDQKLLEKILKQNGIGNDFFAYFEIIKLLGIFDENWD